MRIAIPIFVVWLAGTVWASHSAAQTPLRLDIEIISLNPTSEYTFETQFTVLGEENNLLPPRSCTGTMDDRDRSRRFEFKCSASVSKDANAVIILGSTTSNQSDERIYFPLQLIDLSSRDNFDNISVTMRPLASFEQAFGASYPFSQGIGPNFFATSNLDHTLYAIRSLLEYAQQTNAEVSAKVWGRLTEFFQRNTSFLVAAAKADNEAIFNYLRVYSNLSNDPRMSLFYLDVLMAYAKQIGDEPIFDRLVIDYTTDEAMALFSNDLEAVFNRSPQYLALLEQQHLDECLVTVTLIMQKINPALYGQKSNIREVMNMANRCARQVALNTGEFGERIEIAEVAQFIIGYSPGGDEEGLRMTTSYVRLAEKLEAVDILSFTSTSFKMKELILYFLAYRDALD